MKDEPMPETAEDAGILPREGRASIAYVRQQGNGNSDHAGLPGLLHLGGFRSDMTGIKATHLHGFARDRGQAFVRFDYRGHGADAAHFQDYTVGDWIDDALAVFDDLTQGPQVLIGSSMGGWIMQHVALARADRVVGLVGIATASDFTERLIRPRLDAAAHARLAADGFLTVPSLYDPAGYMLTARLIDDGRRHALLPGPIPIRCPVRLLHGLADPDVPWSLSLDLAAALESSDVLVALIKDGDHRLSEPAHLARISAAVAELSAHRCR
ncbi:MAG TPA: alpha/beta hydrolase [Aliidongia sp.]|uniref:alpha/beta hydrolase n=1 Tax=Aliidongia sp. TaxID=1914230 RepID=UPI002DDD3395|nr:alpha/beta hydrolase [Aliidongia sp.]HEV2674264.1 alpha/beta hydrolase [Aliidongia sp.]